MFYKPDNKESPNNALPWSRHIIKVFITCKFHNLRNYKDLQQGYYKVVVLPQFYNVIIYFYGTHYEINYWRLL